MVINMKMKKMIAAGLAVTMCALVLCACSASTQNETNADSTSASSDATSAASSEVASSVADSASVADSDSAVAADGTWKSLGYYTDDTAGITHSDTRLSDIEIAENFHAIKGAIAIVDPVRGTFLTELVGQICTEDPVNMEFYWLFSDDGKYIGGYTDAMEISTTDPAEFVAYLDEHGWLDENGNILPEEMLDGCYSIVLKYHEEFDVPLKEYGLPVKDVSEIA